MPLVTGSWFLSEPARRPEAFIIGLMVIDLMHFYHDNEYNRGLFSLERCLVHPCNSLVASGAGPYAFAKFEVPGGDMNFSQRQVYQCGGRHPMCGMSLAPIVYDCINSIIIHVQKYL